MALTRRFLTALGIDADKIDEIITAHTESTDALKEQRDAYKEDAEKLAGVQKELDDLKAKQGKDEPYKEKYEKEHADFEAYKNAQTEKETKAQKTEAYKKLLKEAGVSDKHLDAVLRVSDVDSIELDDKGEIKDSKDKVEAIKKDWSDFIVETGTKGADTKTPPQNSGADHKGSEEARKIYEQYRANVYGDVPQNNSTGNSNGGDK